MRSVVCQTRTVNVCLQLQWIVLSDSAAPISLRHPEKSACVQPKRRRYNLDSVGQWQRGRPQVRPSRDVVLLAAPGFTLSGRIQ